MNTEIINEISNQVNIHTGLDVIIIRTFDKKGDAPPGTPRSWQLEVIFSGGAKVTGPVTADEVTAIESDLNDRGWQIEPSLFHSGFNARPVEVKELIFASGADLWPDDYAIEPVTL